MPRPPVVPPAETVTCKPWARDVGIEIAFFVLCVRVRKQLLVTRPVKEYISLGSSNNVDTAALVVGGANVIDDKSGDAFDRFLARLFDGSDTQWVLKGGYAMELRFEISRATKDLDFTVRSMPTSAGEAVLEYLQEAGLRNLGDFFSFRVGVPMMGLDGAPYGGSRYPVEAMMAQRTFARFHMDVGFGDIVLDPLEHIQTRDWFGFAQIPAASVPIIQREQQFAEKLHAYTLPRTGTVNSRVRDLVDMVLLIQSGTLDPTVTTEALRSTFGRRGTYPFLRCWNLRRSIGAHRLKDWPTSVGSTIQ